jgi:hypothetical protein
LWCGGLRRHLSRVPLQALSLCLSSAGAREASASPLTQENKKAQSPHTHTNLGHGRLCLQKPAWKFVCSDYVRGSYNACDTLSRTFNLGSDKAPQAGFDLDVECTRLCQAHLISAWNYAGKTPHRLQSKAKGYADPAVRRGANTAGWHPH